MDSKLVLLSSPMILNPDSIAHPWMSLLPLPEMIEIARPHGAWIHVDAAMAGSALLLPEYRHLFAGVEDADSLSWNPHKWMGTILDTSVLYLRDPEHLIRVMSTNPSYLRSAVDGEVTQYRDWGVPLGRRFRSLKLWFHLRLDGVASIQDRVRRDVANAAWLAERAEADPTWEVVAPVPIQTVCLRHRPLDAEGRPLAGPALEAHTAAWAAAVNDGGRAFVTPSMLDGSWMVRVSVGVERTERTHVEELWTLLNEAANASAKTLEVAS